MQPSQFFSVNDFFLVPLCLLVMYAILRSRAMACKDKNIKKLYYQAFYFKIFCVIAYTIISAYYFGGGDTALYYQAIQDFRTALGDDFGHFSAIISSTKLTENNPLTPYFMFDNYVGDITYNYMRVAGNFFVPRLALIPSLVFLNSYLCICFCFMMFALGGAIRLFKTFYYYYPNSRRELALAILFLPSVGFWSAGLLKDTVCFGALGFLVYGVLNIFIRKKKIVASLFWVLVSSYLLFTIKTYIFLVLLLAITVWIFAETNKLIKDKTLRQVFTFLMLMVGFIAGYFMIQYFTSQDTLKQYQLDNIVSYAENQRNNYQLVDVMYNQQTSYYSVNASNPVSLVLNSIGATFFRPFLWEVRSAAAVLSAAEALAFLLLTVNLVFRRRVGRIFQEIFKDPRILFCFVFAFIFAVGVGASTANFGSLSRYKIPCMPFYMLMILLIYKNTALPYPKWLKKVLSYIK